MIWLAFTKRWAAPLAIVAAFGLAYAYHKVQLNSAYNLGYAAAHGDMAAQVAKANERTAALEQRQREQSAASAASFEVKRDALHKQVDRLLARPLPTLRVCNSATTSGSQLPEPAGTTSAVHAASGGQVDAVSFRDLDLSAGILYARDCESYRLRLQALQRWVSETTKAQRSD